MHLFCILGSAMAAFRYRPLESVCGGSLSHGKTYNDMSFSLAVNFPPACTLTSVELVAFYREIVIVMTNVSESWQVRATAVTTTSFTAQWTNSHAHGLRVGELGYFAFDPSVLPEMDSGSQSLSPTALQNGNLKQGAYRSHTSGLQFGMYSTALTVVGKVASAGLAFLSRVVGIRYFRNDDPVFNPIPNDSNIYGYSLTSARTTYGVMQMTMTVAPYTKVYLY
jgi:hypothetical protein